MSALLFIPLTIATGLAIDYTRGVNAKTDIQKATDAAAISLLKAPEADEATMTERATEVIRNNLGSNFDNGPINVVARRMGNGDIEVIADIEIDTFIMDIGGYGGVAVDSRSVVSYSRSFLDVYLLVDRSASMLLAQDGPDMTAMLNLTRPMIEGTPEEGGEPDGCGFACHQVDGWQSDNISLYDHAVANGIAFRADSVTESAASMARTLLQDPGRNVRVGVVDFSIEANISLYPSSDINAVEAALDNATVDSAQTHYKTLFDMLDATLSGQGSGNTSDSPHIILVLITDGAYTQIYNDGTMRPNAIHSINAPGAVNYYEVFAPSECQALIDQEYEMVVVNTIYDPLINSGRYDDLIKPYANEIDGNLEECATSSYFEASSTADIEVAFDELAEILGKSVARIKQ